MKLFSLIKKQWKNLGIWVCFQETVDNGYGRVSLARAWWALNQRQGRIQGCLHRVLLRVVQVQTSRLHHFNRFLWLPAGELNEN